MTDNTCSSRAECSSTDSVGCLIYKIGKLYNRGFAAHLEKLDLSPGQDWTLIMLAQHGPQTQADLAHILDIDTSTLSRTLQRLTPTGYIQRRPSTTDRRTTVVELTQKGYDVLEKLAAARSNQDAQLTHTLTETEHTQLRTLLQKLMSSTQISAA